MEAEAALVAIDPGWRVGVAWVAADGRLLRSEVVEQAALLTLPFGGVPVVIGDGTGSETVRALLRGVGLDPIVVDERGTSEEGRRLYWRDHPPSGWRRLIPLGMRVPARDLDDYAAYAIALRFLHFRAAGGASPSAPAAHGLPGVAPASTDGERMESDRDEKTRA